MTERLAPELLFVERTADTRDGVELVVGATRDARFGPVVLVGLGGILVETLRDTALALAPLDDAGGRAPPALAAQPRPCSTACAAGRPSTSPPPPARSSRSATRWPPTPRSRSSRSTPCSSTPHGAVALDARIALRDDPPSNPTQ